MSNARMPHRQIVRTPPVEITDPADRLADESWQMLCEGLPEAWLDEIGQLRTPGDDLETSFDIWSVALIAELKTPGRRDIASAVLVRLRKLDDGEVDDEH